MEHNLLAEAAAWRDTKDYALALRDRFTERVNSDAELLTHREFIEKHAYGMGERCFHWMWHLIVDEMPQGFRFLEVGVYKGQVLSLVRLLADRAGKQPEIVGVTLLSSFAGDTGEFLDYPDEDYAFHIKALHDRFGLAQPRIVQGDSTDPDVQRAAEALGPYDIVYVDAGHEYDYVLKDLLFYPALVKPGGLLVIDDASCYLKQPFGFFQGIEPVCRAVRTVIETDPQWEHIFAIVHNRIFRREQ